jgi:hypothetical protein
MNKFISRPSPTFLKFLIACFVLNILYFPAIIYFIATLDFSSEYRLTSEFKIKQAIITIFAGGAMFLWGYCIYYYYKFDRYSKGGLGLLFLPGLISPFYFYKVIWKQKRPLQNI